MKAFLPFLLEYLTPDQRARYKNIHMLAAAREHTDHFFGKKNDEINEPLLNEIPEKSEVHRKVESHLGKDLSHEEYKSGMTTDKYGRQTKLSRLIRDPSLQKEFASDNTRSGAKAVTQKMTRTVRGVEVAGQTNPVPNDEHPSGHSWQNGSCKNIETGSRKRYLTHEIRNGTIVTFVKDQNGKEIYRAALQPYHNNEGHVAYELNSEYGLKTPEHTNHAKNVASRLSGEHKGGSLFYTINDEIYNDGGPSGILHPKATPENVTQALNDEDYAVRLAALQHSNITPEQISKALGDEDAHFRRTAISHPKATSEHITQALGDKEYSSVRRAAIKHPNATSEHITQALGDKEYSSVRIAAIEHPKATSEHITQALGDEDYAVRLAALQHSNITPEHITKALNDKESWQVRRAAIQHPKATVEHITQALGDDSVDVRLAAIRHPKATPEHITKALGDKEYSTVRRAAIEHPKATAEHITQALGDDSEDVRRAAIRHPNVTPEHITQALDDEDEYVRGWAEMLRAKMHAGGNL